MTVKTALEAADVMALRELLAEDPRLANEPVAWGEHNQICTHPLHYVSDLLFENRLDKTREVELAIPLIDELLAAGADVNFRATDPPSDTPLIGAASLGSQDVGIRLIEAGANVSHRNWLAQETALHWAAELGLDRLAGRILETEGADATLHLEDTKWKATPLGWAIHGWSNAQPGGLNHHRDVVIALVRAGSEVKPEWLEAEMIRTDPAMLAALRGAPA